MHHYLLLGTFLLLSCTEAFPNHNSTSFLCFQFKSHSLAIIIPMMLSIKTVGAIRKQLCTRVVGWYSTGPLKNNRGQEVPQDWEYCKLISQELRNKNVNASLSLLFESYFNGKVLDIQIYNSIFHAIHQQNMALSYSEILYQIYREHFPPHSLMLNWMNKLAATHHEPLLQQLKADFETIQQPFPKRPSRRDNKIEKNNPNIKETEETGRPRKSRANRSSEPTEGSKTERTDETPEVEYFNGGLTPQEMLKLKMETDFRSALGQINNGLGNYGKINLYEVQIEFNEPEEDNNDHDDDDHSIYDEEGPDDEMMPDMGLLGLDISKIKIGRVEFIADPNNDKNEA